MVFGAAVRNRSRRHFGRTRILPGISRFQGKYIYIRNYRGRQRAEGHYYRTIRARTPSDVHRRSRHVDWGAARAWIVVGTAHYHSDGGSDRMETSLRGKL